MPKITLDLTTEAITTYAEARGKGENDMTDAEFLEACVIADIRSLIENKLTEDARNEAADNVVVPDITT